jgi:Uma2 family endonuclease
MEQHKYPSISVDDYLILDDNSKSARYEYLDGELRMLAGGSTYHAAIMMNLSGIFHRELRGSPCRAYGSDMRLRLSETRSVYPDIAITCDKRDHVLSNMIHHPTLVIEVLSPGTEVVDRIKKFAYYRECPTIQEYMLVDSRRVQIEVCSRDDGKWTLATYRVGDEVVLESLDIRFPVNEVYEGLEFDQQGQDEEDESY